MHFDDNFELVETLLGWLRTVADCNSGTIRLRISAYNKHSGEDVTSPEPSEGLPLELLLPELEQVFETAQRYRTLLDVAREVSEIIRGDN